MKKKLLIGHFVSLIIGGLIYVSFRSKSLVMFKWFALLSVETQIGQLRELTLIFKDSLPEWFIFSLPDGLWIFSYCSLILLIWGNKITMPNFLWFFLIPVVAISSECGQLLGIFPGTFDVADLTFYIVGTFTPLLFYIKNQLTLKKKTV